MLIIPRLPFPQPNALKEKEREKYDTLKKFIRAVVVPEMQIKLRQGFGRAIRTETDTCAVAILDERAGIGGGITGMCCRRCLGYRRRVISRLWGVFFEKKSQRNTLRKDKKTQTAPDNGRCLRIVLDIFQSL